MVASAHDKLNPLLNKTICREICTNLPQYSKYLDPRAGGGPPSQYYRVPLQGPRAWDWLRYGLLCRLWLWLFRARGGLVCPLRWFAFGVGFGRPAWRWFRSSLMLVRVWCWFWSFAFGLGFGLARRFRSVFPLFGASCWSTHAKNWAVCGIK